MNKYRLTTVTRAQMMEIDRLMFEEYGISLLQMMENAGRDLALLGKEMLGGSLRNKRIAVLCGGGNNGGGGMAAARHLANWGADVQISLAVSKGRLKGAADHQLHTLRTMGIQISEEFPVGDFNLVIDALIGYGLRGVPRGKSAQWITQANQSGIPILALDIPSGLDADSGRAVGACINAHTTLTLALPKVGMLKDKASKFIGELYVGDISVPPGLLKRMGVKGMGLFFSSSIIKLSW